MTKLSIENCFQAAWEIFKKRSWLFIGFTVFIFAISFVVNLVDSNLNSGDNAGLHFISFLISMVFSIGISYAQTRFYLRAHDMPEQIHIKDVWSRHKIWPYALLYIALTVCLVVGLILLIVPGIIFALVSMFAIYIFMDSGRTPMEAFKESRRITKGHLWELFLFSLTLLALNILGVIALVVGLFVTIPVSLLATVHAYRSLEKRAALTPAA